MKQLTLTVILALLFSLTTLPCSSQEETLVPKNRVKADAKTGNMTIVEPDECEIAMFNSPESEIRSYATVTNANTTTARRQAILFAKTDLIGRIIDSVYIHCGTRDKHVMSSAAEMVEKNYNIICYNSRNLPNGAYEYNVCISVPSETFETIVNESAFKRKFWDEEFRKAYKEELERFRQKPKTQQTKNTIAKNDTNNGKTKVDIDATHVKCDTVIMFSHPSDIRACATATNKDLDYAIKQATSFAKTNLMEEILYRLHNNGEIRDSDAQFKARLLADGYSREIYFYSEYLPNGTYEYNVCISIPPEITEIAAKGFFIYKFNTHYIKLGEYEFPVYNRDERKTDIQFQESGKSNIAVLERFIKENPHHSYREELERFRQLQKAKREKENNPDLNTRSK